ncbi:MAG: hypothetical protein Q8P27_01380 [Candidatus Peregrinibacteria bacterium]|nr:hypothetical protein [Candidatus Peregrinibacteria bacterium]
MKFLQKLKLNKWKIIVPLTVGLLVFLIPQISFAAEPPTDPFNDIAEDLMNVINTGFQFLNYLLYPLIMVVAALMDNELIIGVAMESKLLEIWRIIRDWVNIAFVLILVGVALYNVLGVAGEGSNYALKSILPKLVIGLVVVNFSFLAGKVLLDATAVLTTAVYALPSDLDQWDKERVELTQRLCSIIDDEKAEDGTVTRTVNQRSTENGSIFAFIFCEMEEGEDPEYFTFNSSEESGKLNDFGTKFFTNFGGHNVGVALMVNMGQVTDVDIVAFSSESTADKFVSLTMQSLFGILMFLLFGFAYVAMVVVLAARVVVLWISLALSPFIVLIFVFPDLANLGGNELDIKTQFFKHLFVPVIMGVVFSIGFTMLSVLQGSTPGGWLGDIGAVTFGELGETDDIKALASTFGKDISDVGDLIIALAAVIIIWMGTFAAASQTIASNLTQTIKGAGEATGKFLASSPLYATVIPVPGMKDKISLGAALGALPRAIQNLQSKRSTQTQRIADAIAPPSEGQALFNSVADDMKHASTAIERGAISRKAAEDGSSREWSGSKWKQLLLSNKALTDSERTKISEISDSDFLAKLKDPNSEVAKIAFGTEENARGVKWADGNTLPEKKDPSSPEADRAQKGTKAKEALTELKTPTGDTSDEQRANGAAARRDLYEGIKVEDKTKPELFSGATGSSEFEAALTSFSGMTPNIGTQVLANVRIDTTTGKVDAQSFVSAVNTANGATGTSAPVATAPVTTTPVTTTPPPPPPEPDPPEDYNG